ncbi:MAG: hypothetical protein BWK77_08485 [Verrucomicrobia bacterium A1]|nr:MAG: hypothetical protein BWK77_08485 [Verrucomicrobia bacterium A1]
MVNVLGLLSVITAVSCSRSDVRTTAIHVPAMADATTVRIVTNAVLNELDGRTEMFQHGGDIELSKGLVFYHENERLRLPAYQRQILACIRQVGYEGGVLDVRASALPPYPSSRGPLQFWPDRHTLVLSVPGMKTARDANVVLDAIAYARIGGDDPRIVVDPALRSVRVTYNALVVARKNFEHAVACAGYDANEVPADLGGPDAMPRGWWQGVL